MEVARDSYMQQCSKDLFSIGHTIRAGSQLWRYSAIPLAPNVAERPVKSRLPLQKMHACIQAAYTYIHAAIGATLRFQICCWILWLSVYRSLTLFAADKTTMRRQNCSSASRHEHESQWCQEKERGYRINICSSLNNRFERAYSKLKRSE